MRPDGASALNVDSARSYARTLVCDSLSITAFRVATERQWNGADGTPFTATDWHTVVAWEGLAEQCKDLREDDVVHVEGRLQTRSWEDREHAEIKHYRTEIIASVIRPVEAGVSVTEADAVAEMV
jgi:single-strand DNA-binding protein